MSLPLTTFTLLPAETCVPYCWLVVLKTLAMLFIQITCVFVGITTQTRILLQDAECNKYANISDLRILGYF